MGLFDPTDQQRLDRLEAERKRLDGTVKALQDAGRTKQQEKATANAAERLRDETGLPVNQDWTPVLDDIVSRQALMENMVADLSAKFKTLEDKIDAMGEKMDTVVAAVGGDF